MQGDHLKYLPIVQFNTTYAVIMRKLLLLLLLKILKLHLHLQLLLLVELCKKVTKHSVLSSHENSRDVNVEIADENERYDDTDRNVENYQEVVDVLVLD